MNQNFSYSSIADVIAVADESNDIAEKRTLRRFAHDLEAHGVASLNGKGYILRPTRWGMEIVSEADLESESEDDD